MVIREHEIRIAKGKKTGSVNSGHKIHWTSRTPVLGVILRFDRPLG